MNENNTNSNVISIDYKMKKREIEENKNIFKQSKVKVFSIASGKGGVGKTNIVANLGYALSKLGKKVLLFDADMGLGNIDILLGLTPKYNFSHVVLGQKRIDEVTISGPGDVKIIPAASGIQELTQLSNKQHLNILDKLDEFIHQFDIFLIDTAAGISNNVLHFNAAAQEVIVIISPEPTSITDAYALMKLLSRRYNVRRFNIIVNNVTGIREAKNVCSQLQLVTQRFLDIDFKYIGHVVSDVKIPKGVRRQKLVSQLYPDSPSSSCFKDLAEKLSKIQNHVNGKEPSNFHWKNLISI